jgi:hypothetical protein
MAILNRESIRNATDIRTKPVRCPEWGGDVLVRSMKGRERDDFEQSTLETRGGNREVNMANFRTKLLIRTVVDESGQLMFDEDDIKWLGEKSAAPISRIADEAMKLSGISKEDAEELVGNLPDGPSGDSTSGLRVI